jgi:hypothetical protein
VVRSTSPMNTFPDVGASRPAMQCKSVDLPDPDGPMMAVNAADPNSTETRSRATTTASPVPYRFVNSTARAATAVRSCVCMAIGPPPLVRPRPLPPTVRNGTASRTRERAVTKFVAYGRTLGFGGTFLLALRTRWRGARGGVFPSGRASSEGPASPG